MVSPEAIADAWSLGQPRSWPPEEPTTNSWVRLAWCCSSFAHARSRSVAGAYGKDSLLPSSQPIAKSLHHVATSDLVRTPIDPCLLRSAGDAKNERICLSLRTRSPNGCRTLPTPSVTRSDSSRRGLILRLDGDKQSAIEVELVGRGTDLADFAQDYPTKVPRLAAAWPDFAASAFLVWRPVSSNCAVVSHQTVVIWLTALPADGTGYGGRHRVHLRVNRRIPTSRVSGRCLLCIVTTTSGYRTDADLLWLMRAVMTCVCAVDSAHRARLGLALRT